MSKQILTHQQFIRKHRFGFSPSYSEVFDTGLSVGTAIELSLKTIEELGWEKEYEDEESLIVSDGESPSFRVIIKITLTQLEVKSQTVNGFFWDAGRNSKRVWKFIQAFRSQYDRLSNEERKQLEEKYEKKLRWTDYKIPETLPAPPRIREGSALYIPVIGGLLAAFSIGLVFAFILVKGIYLVFAMDALTGMALGYLLSLLANAGNYLDLKKLQIVLLILTATFFFSEQFWQFIIVRAETSFYDLGFLDFVKARLEAGLVMNKVNVGWVGMVLSWLIQLIIPYFASVHILAKRVIAFHINRVPKEVVELAYYYLANDKTEMQIRKELAKKGWRKKEEQDLVFNALGSMGISQKLTKEQLS